MRKQYTEDEIRALTEHVFNEVAGQNVEATNKLWAELDRHLAPANQHIADTLADAVGRWELAAIRTAITFALTTDQDAIDEIITLRSVTP